MKKTFLTMIVFAFIANVSAQLKVDATGNTHVLGDLYLESDSNIIAATGNVPVTFKVNGVLSGSTGSSAKYNVSFGYRALSSNTTGNYNTANGAYALPSNTTGNCNTAIGYYANALIDDLSNTTAIGYNATATSDNQVRIGNDEVTSIGGFVNWTNFSDNRANKNIRTNVPGLSFINGLQPVTYNLDLDAIDGLLKMDRTKRYGRDTPEPSLSQELIDLEKKARETKEKQIQTGFIAQDVEKIAQSIGYDFSGIDVDETGVYGLRYAEFVVPLVKAVQELSEQVNDLSEQNSQLRAQINELQEKDALRSGNAGESVTGLQNAASNGAVLQQNAPNPFNQSTQIKYYLPATVKTAYLCIYDLQGTQLKQTAIQERGEGAQTLYGSELKAGIYLYTLVADGQEVDTKRMILTE